MQAIFKTVAASVLMGVFLAAPSTFAGNGNDQGQDNNDQGGRRVTAPEIHPVAIGAAGILVVGGIALLTTRRRAHAKHI